MRLQTTRQVLAGTLIYLASIGHGIGATDPPAIDVDATSNTGGCPGKIDASTRYTVLVHDINDLALLDDFTPAYTYVIRVTATPVSIAPETPFPTTQGTTVTLAGSCTYSSDSAFRKALSDVKNAIVASDKINPRLTANHRISLSVSAAEAVNRTQDIQQLLACTAESPYAAYQNDPLFAWFRKVSGTHEFTGHANLQPNMNYRFQVMQMYDGNVVDQLDWRCGEKDIVTLSVGPLFSALPSRSYTHQKAPVPPGSSNVNDVLVVNGNSHESILGAALINVHVPLPENTPDWLGFSISSGIVYKFGDSPNVSALGYFGGLTFHLYRTLFLTPGVHVGQFADFPPGFYPGAIIPNQFGELTPQTRTTAHFGLALTYKTNSFKKSQSGSGQTSTTTNTSTKPGSGS